MSGHLQRLAARAMGRTRPLHTLGTLPLAGPETSPIADDAAMPEAIGRMPPAVHSGRIQASVPPLAELQAPGEIESARVTERPQATTNTLTEQAAPPASQERATPLATALHVSRDETTLSRDGPEPLLPRVSPEPAVTEPMSLQGAPQDLSEPPDERDSFSGPAAPPRLMPRVAPKSIQPTLHAALGSPSARPGDHRLPETVEETTEVHVNIGRIEVTAVQEAPAQKPAPRRRQQPMSLDEYLSRRQGGRP